MPRPRDVTPEEARREGERLRHRTEMANREDAYLFAEQLADYESANPESASPWLDDVV